MNKTALLVLMTLATAPLLISTGAVPFGTDVVNEDLVMAPAEGPNGDYAILNGDGEIELILTDANPSVSGDGLNANTVTPLSRVFSITYTGDQTAEVWLTDDNKNIRFYHSNAADNLLEGSENNVTLEPGRSLSVGLLLDTRGDHDFETAGSFTIHADETEANNGANNEASNSDSGADSDDNDPIEDSGGDTNNGGDDDTQTEASTPALPAGTDAGPSQPPGQIENSGDPTSTETVRPGGGLPPNNEDRAPHTHGHKYVKTSGTSIRLSAERAASRRSSSVSNRRFPSS